jgi:hypothetical protein
MATFSFYLFLLLLSLSLTQSCDVFVGMTCTCYESNDLRCTMSKIAPLKLSSSLTRKFHSIDLKFDSDEIIQLDRNIFLILNELFPIQTQNTLTITFRFQNFQSFHAKTSSFANLFNGITSPNKRLTIELHPIKAKSITFDQNTFDNLHVNELSIYVDSLTSSFESIFNNTDITHLNIEGAIVTHEPSLLKDYTGRIQSLKITRMIDTVNNEEFPPFPVQSYTIEAHKMRTLDALSFKDYKQLTGLNIIQPDVFITSKILNGLEDITTLKSLSIDAERISEGAFKHVKQIHTLILGSYLKILDIENLNSLKALKQLDVRYVQFSTLQGTTSCSLADYINRRRMLGLTVYLPEENPDCDCILVFLNNMVDDGSQLIKCQSTNNDRCLFSSCSIVSEYFTRKQKEDLEQDQQKLNTPPVVTLAQSSPPVDVPFIAPSIDFDGDDSPYYPDGNPSEQRVTKLNENDANIISTTSSEFLFDPDESENQFSTPLAKRVHPDPRKTKYLVVSWIPFAITAICLFFSLIIAMIAYVIYHKRRTASFKLVPQTAPII